MPSEVIPKWQVPFKMGTIGAVTVEQDSVDEIAQCVEALARTPIGTRVEEPEYGIPDMTFRQDSGGIERDDINSAIDEWEPRAFHALEEEDIEEAYKRIHIDIDVIGE